MSIYKQYKKPNIKKIGVNYVYMKQNYEFMVDMVKFVYSLKIKELSFNPYCNPTFITDENTIKEFNIDNLERLNEIFDNVREQVNVYNLNVKTDAYDCSWIHKWDQCQYIESFYITWDGYITPCCAIDRKELFNFGSLLENNIETLYNTDKWIKFRNGLINNRPYEVCKKNCFYYYGNLN